MPFGYLFLQAGILTMVYLFTFDTWRIKLVTSKHFWARTAVLIVLWFVADHTAIALGIWHFNDSAMLPLRLLGLPLEEYGMFVTHSVACQMLLSNYYRNEADIR